MYADLRRIARGYMLGERAGHTLQATALVNEAMVRVGHRLDAAGGDRHFALAILSEEMRRVLIDHARRRGAVKRGGGRQRVSLSITALDQIIVQRDFDLIEGIDQAFKELNEYDPSCAQVVRLRFYLGMTAQETADAMGLSLRTVHREWEFAKAFLRRSIGKEEERECGIDEEKP